MRPRTVAVFAGALLVIASLPRAAVGHHKDDHKLVQVKGTTPENELPFIGAHEFVPDTLEIHPGGTVRFTNDEFHVLGVGVPHSWTLLTGGCDPGATDEEHPLKCEFDTNRLEPTQSADVALHGLAPGFYLFVCKLGQGQPGQPDSQIAHAKQDAQGQWTGMVGTLTVAP